MNVIRYVISKNSDFDYDPVVVLDNVLKFSSIQVPLPSVTLR